MGQQNLARNKIKLHLGTEVEHLTHFPKVEGSNSTSDTRREKMGQQSLARKKIKLLHGTVVEY
jgi:hypothetical protein